ncbi:unnamed protein product [Sphagnum balticum]
MQNAVTRVMGTQTFTEFVLTVKLTSGADSTYSFSPVLVDTFHIVQNFSDDYTDNITISFLASANDYANIYDNRTELLATIKIVYIDSHDQSGNKVYDPAPITKQYTAIMLDPKNIRAQIPRTKDFSYPLITQTDVPNVPVHLQLIETPIYKLRHRQFHGMFSNCTVTSVMRAAAQFFGMTQVYMVPPDNTNTYEHLIIPPAKELSDIFDYLQDTYGIYMKGCEFYYTGGILYVYPPYENEPAIEYHANIFNSFGGMYSGSISYHLKEDKTISIISNQKADTKDLTNSAAENHGTAATFLRSSRVIDQYTTTDASGTKIASDNALNVSVDGIAPVVTNSNNSKYKRASDNIFRESSELAKYQAILIKCGWTNALPYSIYPGHAVHYYFDDGGVFQKYKGIFEGIEYMVKQSKKGSTGQSYFCSANMVFRAVPESTR